MVRKVSKKFERDFPKDFAPEFKFVAKSAKALTFRFFKTLKEAQAFAKKGGVVRKR